MAISIRKVTTADSTALLNIYAHYILNTAASFEVEVPALSEFTQRIDTISHTYPYLVCELEGKIIGYAYASTHRERAAYRFDIDVSVYLEESARGKGIGTALYTELFNLLSVQNYYTAYAGITLPNDQSLGLHKKFGFSEIGTHHKTGHKFGKWHDVIWLEKALKDYSIPPE